MPNLKCSRCRVPNWRPNRIGYNPKTWLCAACRREEPTLERLEPIDGGLPIVLDPDVASTKDREFANGRRFALITWHPDAARVDPETFWLIFREGANYALQQSPVLRDHMPKAAELIMLLAQEPDAMPDKTDEFRAAAQWVLQTTAKVGVMLQTAAQLIVLMATARQASPDVLDVLERMLADDMPAINAEWVGVKRDHIRTLKAALAALAHAQAAA